MEDRLDVVAVGIERECGIIAWVVGALPRCAIVAAAVRQGSLMEGMHGVPILGLEREVHAGDGTIRLIHPKLVAGEVLRALRREAPPDSLQNRTVEAPARLKVGNPKVNMIDQTTLVELHGCPLVEHNRWGPSPDQPLVSSKAEIGGGDAPPKFPSRKGWVKTIPGVSEAYGLPKF